MMKGDHGLNIWNESEPQQRTTFLGSRGLYYLLIAQTSIWIVLGVTKLIIGSMYVHDCAVQPLIPVWPILDSFIPILFCGFLAHVKENSSDSLKMKGYIAINIASLLSVVWWICGGIWIYPNWSSKGQCNQTLRTFAFAMITVNWSTMSMWIQLTIRLSCMMHARAKYTSM